jgi:hypothetical protein
MSAARRPGQRRAGLPAIGLTQQDAQRNDGRQDHLGKGKVGARGGVSESARCVPLQAQPHDALGELVERQQQRQRREQQLLRARRGAQRGDSDRRHHRRDGEVRFCREAHRAGSFLPCPAPHTRTAGDRSPACVGPSRTRPSQNRPGNHRSRDRVSAARMWPPQLPAHLRDLRTRGPRHARRLLAVPSGRRSSETPAPRPERA